VKQFSKLGHQLGCAGLVLALSACTVLESDKVDYKSASKTTSSLEIPPDLTQLSRESRYNVPGATVTASGYQAGQTTVLSTTPAVATKNMGDVWIERTGNQRWLVVNRSADQLWEPVREFWKENGFVLTIDQANLGIMETDWTENRAKVPQDFIRNALGKMLDSLYSTGERDRFRTRLERTANGATEIYISHRGMIEVYTSANKDQTTWQPRPVDPELETELLRRLMVKLGVPQEQAKTVAATNVPPKPAARVSVVGDVPVVQLDDGFDRAWRRVGLTLDRTGFTVEDRDRSQGIYFVRYVSASVPGSEPGFFGKLFGGASADTAPLKYRIAVRSAGESTTVSVLTATGTPETSANARKILEVIADDLK